jgi:hypothetical protein
VGFQTSDEVGRVKSILTYALLLKASKFQGPYLVRLILPFVVEVIVAEVEGVPADRTGGKLFE